MNEADSRYLSERALAGGFQLVEHADEADVLVLNTCTVRDSAEQRAYGRLGRFKTLKEQDPRRKIAVCGCLAEQDRKTLKTRLPFVDGVFGTRELRSLGDQLVEWAAHFAPEEELETRALTAPLTLDAITDGFGHLRAFVNVQRGCSYYCTYCIVPHVRGRFDHRPISEILPEVRGRIAQGAREITLVGQTVNAYQDPETGQDFSELLQAVAAAAGLQRLGFITSHPKNVTEKLLQTFAMLPALNARFHLALQSGSNPVLKRMNRKYTLEEYLERIAAFNKACPDWALTTDLIVGFPGETEADFAKTLEIVQQGLFAQVYAFIYSPRRGTPASKWPLVPAEVSSERFLRLMEAVNANVSAYHARKIGTTVWALAQGPSRRDKQKLAAKTSDNVTVIVPIEGDVQRFAATPWLRIRVDEAHVWGCSGRLLQTAEHLHGMVQDVAVPTIDLVLA